MEEMEDQQLNNNNLGELKDLSDNSEWVQSGSGKSAQLSEILELFKDEDPQPQWLNRIRRLWCGEQDSLDDALLEDSLLNLKQATKTTATAAPHSPTYDARVATIDHADPMKTPKIVNPNLTRIHLSAIRQNVPVVPCSPGHVLDIKHKFENATSSNQQQSNNRGALIDKYTRRSIAQLLAMQKTHVKDRVQEIDNVPPFKPQ